MAERWINRREKFRQVLAADRCIHPGSVFDPISARLAEDLGYEVGMFAGSVASMTVLGAPDLIVLTLSEFADQAYRINRAGELPLLVDADHGYGNSLNVMRTVEELETVGVSGLSIEDTCLPTGFGVPGSPELISIDEGVGKMRAAIDARRDSRLVIAGRTSAPSYSSIDDACNRIKAYEAVGVDAIFLVGVKSRNDLDRLAETVKVPIILGSAPSELDDLDYLGSRGVKICLQGHHTFAAAVQAVHDTMKAMRNGTHPSKLGGVASKQLMAQVTRQQHYDTARKQFLEPG